MYKADEILTGRLLCFVKQMLKGDARKIKDPEKKLQQSADAFFLSLAAYVLLPHTLKK